MAGNGGTANYESHNRVSNNCQAAGTSVAGWVAHNPVSVSTDNGATEESAPLFESDEFRMYCYKVRLSMVMLNTGDPLDTSSSEDLAYPATGAPMRQAHCSRMDIMPLGSSRCVILC
eukprot:GHRR01008981.1.p1 GENE.GHRR01008981.1~~GHRR01008981.1.p1  ORF type:complete len:117 (+),score=8.79 GHRR01008981.1:126-476(+)